MASSEEEINLRINGLDAARRDLNDVAGGAQRTARITDQLARAFDHLEREAEDAQRALDRVQREIDDTGPTAELNAELARLQHRLSEISDERRVTEGLQRQFRSATASAAALDHEIAAVRHELNRLNEEYARGRDPAVLRQIEEQQRALNRLASTRRQIASQDEENQRRLARLSEEAIRARSALEEEAHRENARRDEEARRRQEDEENRSFLRRARRRVSNLGDGIGDRLQGAPVPPQALAVGGAIGAAAAVPLLAAIGGALAGAVGAGAAGAGIAGAVMGNPEAFKAEWSAATASVKTELIDAGKVFTGPALEAIRGIGPMVQSWHLDQALAPAAKFVPILARGVEGFASGVVRGVTALVAKGEPAVEALADGFAEMGDAAGDAFESIADGSEGGAEALRDVLFAAAGVVRAFGEITAAAEKTYNYVHEHPVASAFMSGGLSLPLTILDQFSDKSTKVSGSMMDISAAAPAAAAAGGALKDSWEGAAAAMKDAADTADHLFDAQMGMVDANVGWEQSVDDLTESIKENGKNWDITTQKGRDNTSALQDSIKAAKDVRDANIENGMSVAEANRRYEEQIAYLRDVAAKAGMTKEQFDAMTAALLHYIAVDSNKTIRTTHIIEYKYVSSEGRIGTGEDPRTKTGQGYASGGTVAATGVSLVGEQGPELRFMNKGDYIATAQQTERILAASAGGGGGGVATIRVILQYPDGRVIRDELVTTAANQGQSVGSYLGV